MIEQIMSTFYGPRTYILFAYKMFAYIMLGYIISLNFRVKNAKNSKKMFMGCMRMFAGSWFVPT